MFKRISSKILLFGGILFGAAVLGSAADERSPDQQKMQQPKLMFWVKSDDLKSLFKDGARINLWPDASGNKVDLRADGDGRPTLKMDGTAGHPGVVFAGDLNAKPKINESFSLPLNGEWRSFTFFVAGKNISHAGLLDTAPGGVGCLRTMGFLQLCGTKIAMDAPFPSIAGKDDFAVGTITAVMNDAGSITVSTYVNGQLQVTAADPSPIYSVIFANSRIGNNNGGENVFNGEISEALIYKGTLSDDGRQNVERYLMSKYGLAKAKPDDPKFPLAYTPPKPPEQLSQPPPVKTKPATDGLLLWSSADTIKGLKERTPVETWQNSAGEKKDLTTADIANSPKFIPRGINRRPVLRFEGDGNAKPKIVHYFNLPVEGKYPEMTLVVAGAKLSGAGVFDSAPGQNSCLRTLGVLQLCGSKLAGDPFPMLQYQPGPQMISVVVGKIGDNGQYIETYANGHQQMRMEDPDQSVPVLFAKSAIGTNNTGETQFNGDIAEVLIYDHVLSADERKQTDAYLAEKYGITIKSKEQLELEKDARSHWTLTMARVPTALSWFGNTFSGKTEWVQSGISGINVLPDGTVVATSIWDEPHKEIGFYKDGKPVGPVTSGGSSQIVFDDKYFYVGNSGMGKPTAGIRRHAIDKSFIGAEVPWTQLGEAKRISFETPAIWNEVCGLAVGNDEIYVTAKGLKEIRVYGKSDASYKRSIAIDQAGPIVLGKDSTIWLGNESGVVQFKMDGKAAGKAIPDLKVGALAFDPQGRLLVAANGGRNQIIRYDVSGAQPKEIGTIGERGGVFAGPRRGEMGENRLWNMMGLAVDASGNVYVECNGQIMRAYSPEGKFLWQLESTVFCTCSDFDPATDGADIYSSLHHYKYVPGQVPGKDWKLAGITSDPSRFPELADGYGQSQILRRLNGQLFRYSWGESMAIHRQEKDSEIFIPCGYYAPGFRNGFRPKEAPEKKNRFLWIDADGNGQIGKDEISLPDEKAEPSRESFSCYVDDNGGIWEPQDRWGVRYLPLKGFTEAGIPKYDFASEVWYPKPVEFSRVLRAWYFPATDTMYLSGYTWNCPLTGKEYGWGNSGHELICYDNWMKPARKLRCRMPFPEEAQDIKAISIADRSNLAFVGEMQNNAVFAYDTKTGKLHGVIEPDANLFGGIGWIDIDGGVRAFTCKNGEIILLVEDSWAQKQMVYRVKPGAKSVPPITFKPQNEK